MSFPPVFPKSLGFALIVAVAGIAAPAAATAEIQLPPVTNAPPASGPSLWFAPQDIPGLQAKRTDPLVQGFYQQVKSYVDGRANSNLSAQTDDTLSKLAKGAALLHQMGETRTGTSYRDLARNAILQIDGRTPPNIFGQGGNLSTQVDCGRLQSMAEARDMLVGTGLSAADMGAIDAKIADWADAFLGDITLSFRQNNLGMKAGAALITAGLALAGDSRAQGWINNGVTLVNGGFGAMGSDSGFFREGPHYVNYTLNNLLPTAYHVKNRTGLDWFPALRPLVEASLALRHPHGAQVPYEDAVPLVFPSLQVAPGYRGDALAANLMWAWESGDTQNTSNFSNEQLTAATSFIVGDPTIVPAPPSEATMFLKGDSHVASLRSGLDRNSIHATMATAKDYSNLTLITSRHNIPNPLDVAITAFGDDLIVPSTGGPLITRSANRGTYLNPQNRCTVLVNGNAPFTDNVSDAVSSVFLDSEPDGPFDHRFFDGMRTEVKSYASSNRVRRTLGLVGGRYVVVADDVELTQSQPIWLPWRGRGARQVLRGSGSPIAVAWTGAPQSNGARAALDLAAVSTASLSLNLTSPLYAPGFGQEETLQAARLETTAQTARFLSILLPRFSNDAGLSVQSLATGAVAAMRVFDSSGAVDTVAIGAPGAITNVGAVSATDASFVIVRELGGAVTGLTAFDATFVEVRGVRVLQASAPVTVALSRGATGLAATFNEGGSSAQVTLTGLTQATSHAGKWDGAPMPAGAFQTTGAQIAFTTGAGGGTLLAEVGSGGSTGSGSTGTGSTGTGSTGATSSSGGGGGCRAGNGSATPWALALLILLLGLRVVRRSPNRVL